MERRVIQIGYRIDEPRAEAVAINARLYRQMAEDMDYQVDVVAYSGSAFTPLRLLKFLRKLAECCGCCGCSGCSGCCSGGKLPVVHDFFVMPGLSRIVQRYLRFRGRAVSYIKTFINPPGGGSWRSFEGLLRAGLNNWPICRSVARNSQLVTFLSELPLRGMRVLAAPPRYSPAEPQEHTGPVRVGYLGHALRKKGVSLLPGIIRRVLSERPGGAEFAFSFSDLCDDDAALKKLREMADVKGPSDPGDFFARADIYLLPISDGFAASASFNTAWEAMSRGCCVVTAGVSGLPEILTPHNSVSVERPGEESFARAIIDLIDSRNRLQELRSAASSGYRAYYSGVQVEVIGQLRSIYDSF